MKKLKILFVVLIIALVRGICFADIIYLKSGTEIEGIIEEETDKTVTISIKIGNVTYAKAQIESISKSSDEENMKIKEKWKTQQEQREIEQEQWKKFATEQEAKGLIYHNGKWITKDEYEKLTKPKVEEKKEVAKEKAQEPKLQEQKSKEEKPIKLVDTISFQDEVDKQSYSYVVRLPPQYNTKTKWPVLFCFDPGANGTDVAGRFAYAADKLGWIVIGSLDAKNGPWEPIISAQEAMLRDIPKRFSVDEKRCYSAGFSGGARMSFRIAYSHPEKFKGVIPCGAGLPGLNEEISKNIAVYLCVGKGDPNLKEVQEVYGKLRLAGANSYKQEFEGGHEWPSSNIISQALEWLAKQ